MQNSLTQQDEKIIALPFTSIADVWAAVEIKRSCPEIVV